MTVLVNEYNKNVIKNAEQQKLLCIDCRKRTHRKVNIKNSSSLVRNITIITNEIFHLCSFCHKCQKPAFYTLCLLRHRSLPYLCTVCFALPRLRPFSFVLSSCRFYRHDERLMQMTSGVFWFCSE